MGNTWSVRFPGRHPQRAKEALETRLQIKRHVFVKQYNVTFTDVSNCVQYVSLTCQETDCGPPGHCVGRAVRVGGVVAPRGVHVRGHGPFRASIIVPVFYDDRKDIMNICQCKFTFWVDFQRFRGQL